MADATIYTTTYCPFCTAAKRLLQNEDIDFTEIKLDRDPELRQRLSMENNGWRTVPMVFLGDRFIGGHAELQSLKAQEKLKSCLSTP